MTASAIHSRFPIAAPPVAATVVLWASSFPGIRAALDGFSPLGLASVRFALAGAILLALSAVIGRAFPRPADLPRIVLSGALGIAAYNIALNEGELSRLDQNGFVVSSRQSFPTFLRGYAAIYMEHLPVFVSADALLDALHRSYDVILSDIEQQVLIPTLEELLRGMLGRIESSGASSQTQADARLYLEVALGLLDPEGFRPTAAGAAEIVAKARAAFGLNRKAPEAVVVAMNAPGATARDVSWSGVRAGVALANALAFAWGIPVGAIAVNGDEPPEAIAALARESAGRAEPGIWVTARYSGEPNITKPKAG